MPIAVEGEDGLGVVAAAATALDGFVVVRNGPLLVAEDGLVVLGAFPALTADSEALGGVLASLLVVGENGCEEDGDFVRAAF